MTLREYAAIAHDFQIMSDEELMRYDSQKKLAIVDSKDDLHAKNLQHLHTK